MREEDKSTYFVCKPIKSTDIYNTTTITGYNNLTEYFDVVNENAESVENGKFGDRTNERVRIAHDDNDGDAPDIAVDDGVWLEKPTADHNGTEAIPSIAVTGRAIVGTGSVGSDEVYKKPPFLVESIQGFGRFHVYVLKRTVFVR